jgi:hypothetical protein
MASGDENTLKNEADQKAASLTKVFCLFLFGALLMITLVYWIKTESASKPSFVSPFERQTPTVLAWRSSQN